MPGRSATGPVLQAVCVKWGGKYGPEAVNRLYRAIVRHASVPVRFVCITDRSDGDYDPGIELRPFPAFALSFEEMKEGCRLKLAAFAPGILQPRIPAILFDLDTMVKGDVAKIGAEVREKPALYLLGNHIVPLWRVQRRIRRFIGDRYYFGNSSIVAFLPDEFGSLFGDFNRAAGENNGPTPKRLATDERFISYAARDRLRVLSRRIAVKFHWEFMAPWPFLETVRRRLPWVVRRRRGLVAVAFEGDNLKPWRLSAVRPGEIVTHRHLRVRWAYPEFADYWREDPPQGQ